MINFFKELEQCPEFEAGDATLLRELAHPQNDPWPISYSLAQARLIPGSSSLPHRLSSSELYYILQGSGLMHIEQSSKEVQAGHFFLVPGGAEQFIENIGNEDLVFLCIVEPYWSAGGESF